MKQFTKFFTAALFPLLGLGGLHAQTPPVTISWTAELNGERCQLDSVVITNQSNNKTMTVYYPDTIFEYHTLGINESPVVRNTLRVYPNPFSHATQVEFSLARGGEADLAVFDVLGREVLRRVSVLESGTHSYKLSLPSGFYTLRLQTADGVRTARVVSEGNCLNHDFSKINTIPKIFLTQSITKDFHKEHKEINLVNLENLTEILVQDKGVRGGLHKSTDFSCNYGDTLVLQGFITVIDTVLTEEHSVPLTKDTLIVFAFFKKDSPTPITIKWTAELNCAYYPLDSVVITNELTEEKTTVYYPDTAHTYFLYEYTDTLILQIQGFVTVNDTLLIEEHTVFLTEDTLVTFAFFTEEKIPFTEYSLTGTSCQWKNLKLNPYVIAPSDFVIINSDGEMENYITACDSYPAINFSEHTLLVIYGVSTTQPSGVTTFTIVKNCMGKYTLNTTVTHGDAQSPSAWNFAILVPKIASGATIVLNIMNVLR